MNQPSEPDVARLVRELYSWRGIWYGSDEIVDELVAIGPRAVPELIRALTMRPLEWWLPLLPVGPFLPARDVVCALARIGDPRAIDALCHALRRASSDLAPHVIYALSELKDPRAIPALGAVMQGNFDVAWLRAATLAARALAQIPNNQDFESLCRALRYLPPSDADLPDGDYQGPSQEGLVARIVEMRDPAVITPMLSPYCTEYVPARALASFGLAGLPQLLRALDPGALPKWEPLNSDKALEALILLGPDATPAVRRYLAGASRAASSRCAIALCLMGAAEARLIEPVVRALEQEWSADFAVAALVRLVDYRDPSLRRAIPPLRKLTFNPNRSVEARTMGNGLIALIETETADLQVLPLPAGPVSSVPRDLPITSQRAE
jgi:HEAT repeat protein